MKISSRNKIIAFVFIIVLLPSILAYNLSYKFSTNIKHKSKSNSNKLDLSSEVDLDLGMLSLFSMQITKLNVKNLNGLKSVQLTPEQLGNGPIYCEGWNKFFTSEYGNQENKFKINKEYQAINTNKKANPEDIPKDNQEFYFECNKNFINVYTSKLVSDSL